MINEQSQFSSLAEAPWQQNWISPQHRMTEPRLPTSVHEEQTCDAQMWSTGTFWSCTRQEVGSLVADSQICIVSLLNSSPWCRNVTVVKRTHKTKASNFNNSTNSYQNLRRFKYQPPFSLTVDKNMDKTKRIHIQTVMCLMVTLLLICAPFLPLHCFTMLLGCMCVLNSTSLNS